MLRIVDLKCESEQKTKCCNSGDESSAQSIGPLHEPIHECRTWRCDRAGQVIREHPVCDALSNSEVAVELADLHRSMNAVDLVFAIGPRCAR